ncbi:hypothetical protein MASR2M79_05190 [Aminivibrio sp.]
MEMSSEAPAGKERSRKTKKEVKEAEYYPRRDILSSSTPELLSLQSVGYAEQIVRGLNPF